MAKKAGAKTVGNAAVKASDKGSKSVLEAELSKDEKLLWSHQPGAGAYALAHLRAAMMGMPFIMLALLWNGMVIKSMTLPYVGVITWLFALLGVVYLSVPMVAFLRAKVFVFYALTTKRLMIVSLFPKHQVQSFAIKDVKQVFTKDIHYGVGSLIIDAQGARPKNPAKARAGFYGVPYIARVEDAFNMLKNPEASRAAAAGQARAQQAQERAALKAKEASMAPSAPAAPSSQQGAPAPAAGE